MEEMGKDDLGAPDGAEPSAFEGQVKRLAAAIKNHARDEAPKGMSVEDAWRDYARTAFAEAEIELTDDQFRRAWRRLWQSAFMGGNYTLDAKRVLAAAFGRGEVA